MTCGYKALLGSLCCALLVSCGPHAGRQPSATAAAHHHRLAVLERLRGFIIKHHYTFHIGFTSKLGAPIASVTGAIRERIKERRARGQVPPAALGASEVASRATYDARDQRLISAIQDQGRCGTCSVFAVVGLLETATAVARHEKVHASEQDIINCYPDSCKGDVRVSKLLRFLSNRGTASRDDVRYTRSVGTCSDKLLRCYRLTDYGYVDNDNEIPSNDKIKLAIAQRGAVISWMYATPLFEAYVGNSVFYERVDPKHFDEGDSPAGGGHEVLIVGWDDRRPYGNGRHGAWLVKNSWGTDWGDHGYAWIAYGSNAIGTEARWATASAQRVAGCTL